MITLVEFFIWMINTFLYKILTYHNKQGYWLYLESMALWKSLGSHKVFTGFGKWQKQLSGSIQDEDLSKGTALNDEGVETSTSPEYS